MSERDPVLNDVRYYSLPATEAKLVLLRIPDKGVAVGRDQLSYSRGGSVVLVPYTDITEINLAMTAQHRAASFATMQIMFRNGKRLLVTSTDAWVRPTPERVQEYYRFKADLHARLLAAGASHIRFTTGYSAARNSAVKLVLIFAGAFFTLVPLVLFFMTRQPQALLVMLLGVLFLVPFVVAGQRNSPGTYDPRNPPDMLR
jgi:hypothetical protein